MNSSTSHTLVRSMLLATPILLGACDPVKAPGAAKADPLPSAAYPQIVAAEGLSGYIAYDAPKVSATKPMEVTVPVRALTDNQDLNIQYRFSFFDQNGVPLNDNPDWRFLKLPSRNQRFLSGFAREQSAVDWRLEIRPAK
ncbi:MAG: YcfL family protein [Phycisphaerales bacterium]